MLVSTIRRLIAYVRTHAFTGEYRMLQARFPDANTDGRTIECDSCGGRIGGTRFLCLDCDNKSTESFDSVDLCSAPQCAGARITRRDDLEGVHEPSHRLVKLRTNLRKRNYGRLYTAATDAFKRVEETHRKIAEITSHPDEETGLYEQKTSSSRPTSTKTPANGDQSSQDQVQEEGLPTCVECKGPLSFPFWFCIFCKG